MKNYRVGIIGYGLRSKMMIDLLLDFFQEKIQIIGVCDVDAARASEASQYIDSRCGGDPKAYDDYRDLIADKPDLIFVFTSWRDHIRICCDIIEAGIPVASEVGGCNSIEECWKLVETWEKTQTPYMFLENCCFGRLEQLALNMKKQGVLGNIVHCEGGYCHDLREEVTGGIRNGHYRLSEYAARNCENYPSHDFLPIAKVLDMNSGNRPVSLFSSASSALGIKSYISEKLPDDIALQKIKIHQGDIISTIIKFANGETVTLSLDTTLPRPYSRRFTVRGTKGSIFEDTKSVFIDGIHNEYDFEWDKQWNNVETFYEQYDSETWKEYRKNPVGSHDGMDYLELKALFDALDAKRAMPIDVYDAAFTMSLTPLSEMSIATNAVVAIPDFSKGKWVTRFEK